MPPRSWPVSIRSHGWLSSATKAVAVSFCACSATASATCIAPPVTVPGGKPVTALPGLTPRSPFTTVGPVLVTVEAPSTAKLCAAPNDGAVAARARPGAAKASDKASNIDRAAP